jgi:hypothetical protein
MDAGPTHRIGARDDVDDSHPAAFFETITRKASLRKSAWQQFRID